MESAKKVSDEYSVAGQPSADDLNQAAESGFKSVLNLRSPNETNTLPDEQQQAEAAGLNYANVPLNSSVADEVLVNRALEELEDLPKPVLIHCGAGLRAGAIALIATARDLKWTLEQLTAKANEVGLSLDQPHLKQFIQETYSSNLDDEQT
ncbi:MAG: protein tyrosine phosphatase family protein [Oscillatoriales cyanobacterium C42_A2020_001]|nr:protein tyrosine phosphatase family protein [Leptolyngbyaceae cyanobacterium C42_A2020_001]